MRIRLLFLLLGYGCIQLSMKLFPKFDKFSLQLILNKLVFQPFHWLGGILFYIFGFLLIARVITLVIEGRRKHSESYNGLWCYVFLAVWFIMVGVENVYVSVSVLVVSLFYGIMDANHYVSDRQYY